MAYKKLKPHLIPEETREAEMRKIWREEYCLSEIETFDSIKVCVNLPLSYCYLLLFLVVKTTIKTIRL